MEVLKLVVAKNYQPKVLQVLGLGPLLQVAQTASVVAPMVVLLE